MFPDEPIPTNEIQRQALARVYAILLRVAEQCETGESNYGGSLEDHPNDGPGTSPAEIAR